MSKSELNVVFNTSYDKERKKKSDIYGQEKKVFKTYTKATQPACDVQIWVFTGVTRNENVENLL